MTPPQPQDQPDELQKAIDSFDHTIYENCNCNECTVIKAAKQLRQIQQCSGTGLEHLTASLQMLTRAEKAEEQLRQVEKECASVKESLHFAEGVADLAMKHRDSAEQERDQLKAGLEKCKNARNHLTGEFVNPLDYLNYQFPHTVGHIPLIQFFGELEEALSSPIVQSILNQQSEVTTQCHPQTKPNVT